MSVKNRHLYGVTPDGELDEVFVGEARIHIERMSSTSFWLGIQPKDQNLPQLMVNTGVHRGVWYFNVEEDMENGQFFRVQRPRRPIVKVPKKRTRKD